MYSAYSRNKYSKSAVKIKNLPVSISVEHNFFPVLPGESFEKHLFEGAGFCLINIHLSRSFVYF